MNPISPKAYTATGGAILAAPVVNLIIWAMHISPPPEIIADMVAVASALFAFAGAYLAPHFPTPTVPPANPGVTLPPPANQAPAPVVVPLAAAPPVPPQV